MNPKVSILIPMGRGIEPSGIEKTFSSIKNQTVPVLEIVIITADLGVQQIYEKFVKEKLWSLNTKINVQSGKNLGSALRQGVLMCEGDYIARIDVGDVMHADRIKNQIMQLERNSADVVCSQALKIMINNGSQVKMYKSKFNKNKIIEMRDLIYINPIMHPTVMMRRKVVIAQNYQESKYMEDYELWINLLKNKNTIFLSNDCLTTIHIDPLQFNRRSEFQIFTEELKILNMKKGGGINCFKLFTSFLVRISYLLAPLWVKKTVFRWTNLELID
jgi:glycosyltransferase involved in cell wall biosynthesis